MPYQFVTSKENYARLASGQVFYHVSGSPVFPVRLMSEVFQLCQEIRRREGATAPCVLYDPCCGAACHLSTLAFLHWQEIGAILCSDIDGRVLNAAESNLSLLTLAGMDRRCAEIAAMRDLYGKASHAEALVYAEELRAELSNSLQQHVISTRVFQANAFEATELRKGVGEQPVDLIFADIPQGRCAQWKDIADTANPIAGLLESLRQIAGPATLLAIASQKHERIEHTGYTRLKRLQLGKRMVTVLRPSPSVPAPTAQ